MTAALSKEHVMSGIIVGVDGSANARFALQWAVKEAASKHEPLTVLTVNEVAASFWTHQPITVSADQALLQKARQAGAGLVDKKVLHHSRCPVVVVPAPQDI